jgi:hypothetical protein
MTLKSELLPDAGIWAARRAAFHKQSTKSKHFTDALFAAKQISPILTQNSAIAHNARALHVIVLMICNGMNISERLKPLSTISAILLALVVPACGGGSGDSPSAPRIVDLKVDPA